MSLLPDDPVCAMERLAFALDDAYDALHFGHDLARGDACLDGEDPLTWIAFGLVETLADLGDEVARYRHAARDVARARP